MTRPVAVLLALVSLSCAYGWQHMRARHSGTVSSVAAQIDRMSGGDPMPTVTEPPSPPRLWQADAVTSDAGAALVTPAAKCGSVTFDGTGTGTGPLVIEQGMCKPCIRGCIDIVADDYSGGSYDVASTLACVKACQARTGDDWVWHSGGREL